MASQILCGSACLLAEDQIFPQGDQSFKIGRDGGSMGFARHLRCFSSW
jgi:hypothetical protein